MFIKVSSIFREATSEIPPPTHKTTLHIHTVEKRWIYKSFQRRTQQHPNASHQITHQNLPKITIDLTTTSFNFCAPATQSLIFSQNIPTNRRLVAKRPIRSSNSLQPHPRLSFYGYYSSSHYSCKTISIRIPNSHSQLKTQSSQIPHSIKSPSHTRFQHPT